MDEPQCPADVLARIMQNHPRWERPDCPYRIWRGRHSGLYCGTWLDRYGNTVNTEWCVTAEEAAELAEQALGIKGEES
jgi:hypothetical protein